MGDSFEVEFDPSIGKLGVGFVEWSQLIDNWSDAMTDVRDLFRNHEKRHLDSGGKSTGAGFAKLSDIPEGRGYRSRKAITHPGRPILTRDGVLRLSLTSSGPGSIAEVGTRTLKFGTSVEYAKAHSEGEGNLPVRKPIRFDRKIQETTGLSPNAEVPLGTGMAQILQGHIVRTRKLTMKGLPGSFINARTETLDRQRTALINRRTT